MKSYYQIFIVVGLVVITLVVSFWFLFSKEVAAPTLEIPKKILPEEVTVPISPQAIIGNSVEGRVIESYTYGQGSTTVLFVGGVHGGYEWNSILLAYDFIDELATGTFIVPENITIVVIPVLNPDGLFAATGIAGKFTATDIKQDATQPTGVGRFNANEVDLNRNFACKWQSESTWRNKVVSAGSAPFSEPEAQALRTLVTNHKPTAVVFWHSQANAVYASECQSGILPQTLEIMTAYAEAANYKAVPSFDTYPITGDAEGWLASIGIPAVTVELETRTSAEWPRNKEGILALLKLLQ